MKKYLSAFVCGFGAGVLQIVPVAKSFSCCLIIPVAAYLALVLERKSKKITGESSVKFGVIIGLLTGLYAAIFGSVFELLITFITKTNDLVAAYPELHKMIYDFPLSEDLKAHVTQLLSSVIDSITTTGFSWLYAFSLLFNNFLVNMIFGMIGGLIGVQIINSRIKNRTS